MSSKKLDNILPLIFETEELKNNPPVLVDIGASGSIHSSWKAIAPYSVCIAFDADNREMSYIEKENSGYKKLIVFNSLVAGQKISTTDFYLTHSPFCSSSLEPDLEKLKSYECYKLFEVEKKIQLNTVYLPDVLNKLGYGKIDWYKSDSQGTDLRIFKSLDNELSKKIIAADFEPGIIDAYKNEDKLYALMNHMYELPFWICKMDVKKIHRINQNLLSTFSSNEHKKIHRSLNPSPGWAEVTYLNTFAELDLRTTRDLLLGWVIATLNKQHGFALEIIELALDKNHTKIFDILKTFSRESLTHRTHDLRKRILGKIIRQMKKFE